MVIKYDKRRGDIMFDPRSMNKILSQFGIKTKEINAIKVVIELEDKTIVISNPNITVMEMKGERIYQIVGEEKETPKIKEEDIELVMKETGKNREEVIKILEEVNGDLAEAILRLKED